MAPFAILFTMRPLVTSKGYIKNDHSSVRWRGTMKVEKFLFPIIILSALIVFMVVGMILGFVPAH